MLSKSIIGGVSVVLAAGVSAIVACSDTPTTLNRDRANVRVDAGAAAARSRIHKRNAHEWVGVAHNKVLDDWRREMRKPGVLTHNLCNYVIDFATRDERMPPGRASSLAVRRKAIGAAAKSSTLCQALAARGGLPSSLVSRGSSAIRIGPSSATLYTLQAEIENAVTAAENSYDLASRLNAVLDASASLEPWEQTVVSATVSIAQNSYEYWESQFPAVVQEIADEYGTCATERLGSGYSLDAARDACLSGETFDVTFRGLSPSAGLGPTANARFTSVLRCGPSLREGFRHVAYNDARGAFAGAFAGIFGSAAGIVGGALIGGSGASVWAAGENAWATFWCIMAK